MAAPQAGFTRASALGPIAQVVDQQGGSMSRVMQGVDLPFTILEKPDMLVPLREQFRLLERAAQETGDSFFGARLGQQIRLANLSAFGQWVTSAHTLRDSIQRSNAGLNRFLQTATALKLEEDGHRARWSITLLDPASKGRFQNELLGVCYLIDGIALLRGSSEPEVPHEHDMQGAITAVTALAVSHDYPRVEWVAGKLGMTRRSLQRRLQEEGTTFRQIADRARDRAPHHDTTIGYRHCPGARLFRLAALHSRIQALDGTVADSIPTARQLAMTAHQ